MFSKNAENILNQTTRNAERLSLLEKEIENPFFETKKARESRKSAENTALQNLKTLSPE